MRGKETASHLQEEKRLIVWDIMVHHERIQYIGIWNYIIVLALV